MIKERYPCKVLISIWLNLSTASKRSAISLLNPSDTSHLRFINFAQEYYPEEQRGHNVTSALSLEETYWYEFCVYLAVTLESLEVVYRQLVATRSHL